MSLLMQALKKAERAKQSHHGEEEPAKPSEAFDQVLELAPQEPLTLSPLDMDSPEPMPAPASAQPGAPHDPAPQSRRARNPPPPPPQPRVRPRARPAPVLSARAMRLGALGAGALIVASVFGYIYWNAMYGAGSSRHLPPVPMPGQDIPAVTAPALAGPALLDPATISAPIPLAAESAPAPSAPLEAAPPPSSRDQMPPDAYMRGGEPLPAQPAPPPRQPVAAAPAGSADIRVARASNPEQITPGIAAGYAAYGRGDMAAARQHYQDALRQDPASRDARLGLAAVSLRAGDHEQAAGLYARLLEADPNDTDALAGMASLRSGDSAQSESRLRQAAERHPESGPTLFALGNLYARQGRWPEAQQQYFRAYTSAPQNADYAFNLAVGLDRLNQSRLALTYYQKALELAGGGQIGFDRAAASQRVLDLSERREH